LVGKGASSRTTRWKEKLLVTLMTGGHVRRGSESLDLLKKKKKLGNEP